MFASPGWAIYYITCWIIMGVSEVATIVFLIQAERERRRADRYRRITETTPLTCTPLTATPISDTVMSTVATRGSDRIFPAVALRLAGLRTLDEESQPCAPVLRPGAHCVLPPRR